MNETINLSNFNYLGSDAVERLTKAFRPLYVQMDQTPVWFQSTVLLPAFAQGGQIHEIVRGIARYAQSAGFQIQGVDGLRNVA